VNPLVDLSLELIFVNEAVDLERADEMADTFVAAAARGLSLIAMDTPD